MDARDQVIVRILARFKRSPVQGILCLDLRYVTPDHIDTLIEDDKPAVPGLQRRERFDLPVKMNVDIIAAVVQDRYQFLQSQELIVGHDQIGVFHKAAGLLSK